jgi:hypothetical protein
MLGKRDLFWTGMAMLLNEYGINQAKPHPSKQLARRLFAFLCVVNLFIWSLITAINCLFNLSFVDIKYDVCLFGGLILIHTVLFKTMLKKVEHIPYKNIMLQAKDPKIYSFCSRSKMALIMFGIFTVLSVVYAGIAYGPLYYLYVRGHQLVSEIEFVLSSWNTIYLIFLFAGYMSCCLFSRYFLLSKFEVYYKKDKASQAENKVISIDPH